MLPEPSPADRPPLAQDDLSHAEDPRVWTRGAARRACLTGAARSLGLILATLAFGLAWAGAERWLTAPPGPDPARPATYDREPMHPSGDPPSEPEPEPAAPDEPGLFLVDGFNVLHAGVLKGRDRAGWWTAAVQLRLVERAARLEPPEAEVCVVFDAATPRSERCAPGPELARVQLVFTPSADDWIVRHVRQSAAPERLAVVTGDRQVAGRARHAGARIVPPRAFLARCPAPDSVAEGTPV